MTEEYFREILRDYEADENPGWAGLMVVHEDIQRAIILFGETRTKTILKEELGE